MCGLNLILSGYFLIREKTKLREDIVARRQKKIILRRARQKYLEEAALREAELLQELDRLTLPMVYLVLLIDIVCEGYKLDGFEVKTLHLYISGRGRLKWKRRLKDSGCWN